MENYDVIVVGAGISGMSFAHFAKKANQSVLVLEQSARVGGSFHSSTMQKAKSDFWIELGAHTCYNSYQTLIGIMEDCGIINEMSPREKVPFRALVGDQIKSFPSQINFLELLVSIPRVFGKKKTGQTVASYYGSILGKKNFKKIFSALFSAVPSQNADEFPADALFKKRERRKDMLKDYTMKKGLSSITDAIASYNELELNYGVEIGKIEKGEDDFIVKTNEGVFKCKNLSICTSITSAPGLIAGVAPDVVDRIAKIKYQKIESYGVIVPKDATRLKPFAGLVPTNDDFFSAVSRDTVADHDYRGFTFHFKPDILSIEQKQQKVCTVLGVEKNQLIETQEKINIVPSLRLGHYELIDEIDALLKDGNLFLSGNYFAGLSIEDCVVRSKEEVERMVKS